MPVCVGRWKRQFIFNIKRDSRERTGIEKKIPRRDGKKAGADIVADVRQATFSRKKPWFSAEITTPDDFSSSRLVWSILDHERYCFSLTTIMEDVLCTFGGLVVARLWCFFANHAAIEETVFSPANVPTNTPESSCSCSRNYSNIWKYSFWLYRCVSCRKR